MQPRRLPPSLIGGCLLLTTSQLTLLVLLFVLRQSLSLLSTWAVINAKLQLVIALPIMEKCVRFIFDRYLNSIGTPLRRKLRQEVLLHFQQCPNSVKKAEDMDALTQKITSAGWVLLSSLNWGIPSLADSAVSIFSAIWALVTFGYGHLIPLVAAIFAVYYVVYLRPKQQCLADIRKDRKELQKANDHKRKFVYASFQDGRATQKDISLLERPIEDKDQSFDIRWEEISWSISMVSSVMATMCLSQTSTQLFWATNTVLSEMVSAISGLAHFLNHLSARGKDWDNLAEWYKEHSNLVADPHQKPFPSSGLHIKLNTKQGKCVVKGRLSIKKGNAYMLVGPSGVGKTVALDAISGKDEGVRTRQFADCFLVCTQTSRDNLPRKGMTIREVFAGEQDDQLLKRLLTIVQMSERFSSYDEPYDGLSGGERMRVAVALAMYQCWSERKTVLVLDEPEQGLDAECQTTMLNQVIQWCKTSGKTLLMVYHGNALDVVQLRGIDVAWKFARNGHTTVMEQGFSDYVNTLREEALKKLQ